MRIIAGMRMRGERMRSRILDHNHTRDPDTRVLLDISYLQVYIDHTLDPDTRVLEYIPYIEYTLDLDTRNLVNYHT